MRPAFPTSIKKVNISFKKFPLSLAVSERNIFQVIRHKNHIAGVMVSTFASSVIDRGFTVFTLTFYLKYLQAHHQFYRPEFENYITLMTINSKPPKLKTWWCTKFYVDITDVIGRPHDFLPPRSDEFQKLWKCLFVFFILAFWSSLMHNWHCDVHIRIEYVIFYLFLVNIIGNCYENKYIWIYCDA
jgi:hypothetical protein